METTVEGLFWSEYCGAGLMGGPFAGHGLVMVVILALTFFSARLYFARKVEGAGNRGDAAFDILRQRYTSAERDGIEYVRRREPFS